MTRRLFVLLLGAAACGGTPAAPALAPAVASPPTLPSAAPTPQAPGNPGAPAIAAPAALDVNAQLDAFFETYDQARLARSPQAQSFRAIKTDYDRWDDPSDAAALLIHRIDADALADMRARFATAALDPARRLSYALFEDRIERDARAYAYRDHGYVFDQMNGAQSQLPAFLINIHKVSSKADADAYVRRLERLGPTLRSYLAVATARAAKGNAPPRWVFPFVISDARNVVTGAPFDNGPDSALYADLKAKVAALQLADRDAKPLLEAGRNALMTSVHPAYLELIAAMEDLSRTAATVDGVWRFADGAAYYAERLRTYTTTDLSADQIHDLGVREVARLHTEMRALMQPLGMRGSFPAFLRRMRDRKDIYFPEGAEGRARYLAETQRVMADITAKLPRWFGILPKAPLEVKPVEAFREKSAGKAFYQRPAPDGSRPGTYYVNLYRMAAMPVTEIEALAYHEGVPGHHLQLAIQTELGDLPAFRKFGGVTAYSEGWGLYSEKLAKEMGQYSDPLRDFGRLQMELHRAIRLVVDTGIHHKRWSRARAIRYVEDNSAEPAAAATKAIERYIVFPGQATAYMIGRLKISELRARAETALGPRFDIRAFHDVVLRNGPIPLAVLEQEVDRWSAAVASAAPASSTGAQQ